jgi:ClpP class serine protease
VLSPVADRTALNADIFAYFGDITDEGADGLCEQLGAIHNRRKNTLLILATYGGEANAAYRIARRIQKHYSTRVRFKPENSPEFWCFVPTSCKSAGTIVTLGADRGTIFF